MQKNYSFTNFCVFLSQKTMTVINRTESINGGDISQEIVNRLSTQTIIVSPDEVKDFFQSNVGIKFDPYNSVVLFDGETNCVYGYILAHTMDIPNIDVIFQHREDITTYLNNSNGLYISDVVIRKEIKDTPLIKLLNVLHLAYCEGNINKEGLYVWMDLGEVIFSRTKQDCGFSTILLNNISRTFYDKCI